MTEDAKTSSVRWKTLIKFVIRVTILMLVTWGIWRTIVNAQQEFQDQKFSLNQAAPHWLFIAGVFYAIGLLPCWLFWHRTLKAMGQRPRWRETLRAFWIGHLGKYVPGKAMVVVLRAGLVRGPNADAAVAATSVFVETLTMMAVGAFVSAAVLVWISPNWMLTALAVGLMVAAGVPTWPPLFRKVINAFGISRASPQVATAVMGLDLRLMLTGWVWVSIGWLFLGLSLWATLRALPVPAVTEVLLADLPLLVASVALAMVAGFLSLIPGGLGVRDWILMSLLAPKYGAAIAVISAVVLRVVWLLTELLISGILYVDVLRNRRRSMPT